MVGSSRHDIRTMDSDMLSGMEQYFKVAGMACAVLVPFAVLSTVAMLEMDRMCTRTSSARLAARWTRASLAPRTDGLKTLTEYNT